MPDFLCLRFLPRFLPRFVGLTASPPPGLNATNLFLFAMGQLPSSPHLAAFYCACAVQLYPAQRYCLPPAFVMPVPLAFVATVLSPHDWGRRRFCCRRYLLGQHTTQRYLAIAVVPLPPAAVVSPPVTYLPYYYRRFPCLP